MYTTSQTPPAHSSKKTPCAYVHVGTQFSAWETHALRAQVSTQMDIDKVPWTRNHASSSNRELLPHYNTHAGFQSCAWTQDPHSRYSTVQLTRTPRNGTVVHSRSTKNVYVGHQPTVPSFNARHAASLHPSRLHKDVTLPSRRGMQWTFLLFSFFKY